MSKEQEILQIIKNIDENINFKHISDFNEDFSVLTYCLKNDISLSFEQWSFLLENSDYFYVGQKGSALTHLFYHKNSSFDFFDIRENEILSKKKLYDIVLSKIDFKHHYKENTLSNKEQNFLLRYLDSQVYFNNNSLTDEQLLRVIKNSNLSEIGLHGDPLLTLLHTENCEYISEDVWEYLIKNSDLSIVQNGCNALVNYISKCLLNQQEHKTKIQLNKSSLRVLEDSVFLLPEHFWKHSKRFIYHDSITEIYKRKWEEKLSLPQSTSQPKMKI